LPTLFFKILLSRRTKMIRKKFLFGLALLAVSAVIITCDSASASDDPNTINITGLVATVTAPVAGQTPVTAGAVTTTPANAATVATIMWSGGPPDWNQNAPFANNQVYTVTVTLIAASGYTFTGLSGGTGVTINATPATIVANLGASLTLSGTFTLEIPPISAVNVSVAAPVNGATTSPAITITSINPSGSATITTRTWTDYDDEDWELSDGFVSGRTYIARITLARIEGHTFTGISPANVQVNGGTAFRSIIGTPGDTLVFTFEVDAVPGDSGTAITDAAVTVTAPMVDANPVITGTVITSPTDAATVTTVVWSGGPPGWTQANAFINNSVYTVTVTLTANTWFTFTGLATGVTINTDTATPNVSNAGATLTISRTFTLGTPPIPINNVNVNITVPKGGETAVPITIASISPANSANISSTTWLQVDDPYWVAGSEFVAGKDYIATVTLTGTGSHTFTGIDLANVTVNGGPTTNRTIVGLPGNTLVFTFTVEADEP
jgi:hypothetical protein